MIELESNTDDPAATEPQREDKGYLLTADAVARRLSVPRARVYELAKAGILPVVRIGRQLRVEPTELNAWIRRGGTVLASTTGAHEVSSE